MVLIALVKFGYAIRQFKAYFVNRYKPITPAIVQIKRNKYALKWKWKTEIQICFLNGGRLLVALTCTKRIVFDDCLHLKTHPLGAPVIGVVASLLLCPDSTHF